MGDFPAGLAVSRWRLRLSWAGLTEVVAWLTPEASPFLTLAHHSLCDLEQEDDFFFFKSSVCVPIHDQGLEETAVLA